MRLFYRMAALFRSLFQNRRVATDLAEEMRFHIERETEANVSRGMSRESAERAARIRFGSFDASYEQSRDERTGAGVREMVRDMRFGARLFRKSPGFGVAAIAIIALTIGAATAVFSVVHGVLLRPMPFREPERLVNIWLLLGPNRARSLPAAADVMDVRQLTSIFDGVAFTANVNLNHTGVGEPRRLQGARVSANLFSVLGVTPALGRVFTTSEEQAGDEHVVLLSDALWRARFNADTSIVGKQVQLNGRPHTVVGVMRPEFHYPSGTFQAWIPLVVTPPELAREIRENYRMVARLAPGVSVQLASNEVDAMERRLFPPKGAGPGPGLVADPMLDDTVRAVRPTLRLVLGAVLVLLLIACVNLSNLFGARARARSGEWAVRLALGASRKRLAVQAVAESVPILVVGGALGILLAKFAVQALVASAPAGLPRIENVALNAPVIVFALTLLTLTCLTVSIAPSVQAWSSDFTSITKDGGRAATARRSERRRLGVAVQIACALPLLFVASLLLRSAMNLTQVDLGFNPASVATISFEVSRTKYPSDREAASYYSRVIEAVEQVPGVESAALTNRIPLGNQQSNSVQFENPTGNTSRLVDIDSRTVSPQYFATLGIPLVAGRGFDARDDSGSVAVGIVDEQVAQSIWPNENVIGKRFRLPSGDWVHIVGVVGHVRTSGLEVDPRAQVYWSYRQWTQNRMVLAVKSDNPATIVAPIIRAVRSVDPDQSFYDVHPLSRIIERSTAQRDLTTTLVVSFGVLALILASVGVYGVVAYGVTQRLREFGIRVALGATRGEVTRLVVWQGTSTALIGAAVGLVIAIAAGGVTRNLVFGVAPRDVASILGATVVLTVVAVFASYLPSRRAAAVDPVVTLRSE